MTKKVVVAGATGFLGKQIVNALIEQGAEVTALVRASSNRSKLEEMGVKSFVAGDMMDPVSLREALSSKHGFDAIIASAAGYTRHTKGDNPKTDTIGYQNLADAAKEEAIPRFVLISILECDKAASVPHFYHKYQIEKYLAEKKQPFIALRAGAFLDQAQDYIPAKLAKGIFPVFFGDIDYGTIFTADLARYAAMAAVSLPDSVLNTNVDVGWSTPVNGKVLAAAFEKLLGKPVKPAPVFPPFVTRVIAPIIALFNPGMRDMLAMLKWVNKGEYISRNTQKQKELFGELPTIEEGVRRYCLGKGLVG